MFLRAKLLTLGLLMCISLLYAQKPTQDSVLKEIREVGYGLLNKENLDTLLKEVKEAKYLAYQIKDDRSDLYAYTLQYTGTIFQRMSKLDSSIIYTQKSINLLKTLDNLVLKGDAYNLQGLNYRDLGDYMTARAYFDTSMVIYGQSQRPNKITQPANNLGLLYKDIGNYQKSLEFYQQVLRVHQSNQNIPKILSVKGNMSIVLMHMHEFDKAEEMAKNCIELGNENVSDTTVFILLTKAYSQLGRIYENKGVAFNDTSYFQKALKQHQKAMENWRLLGGRVTSEDTVTTLLNIASTYQYLEAYEEALEYYNLCLPLAEGDNQLPRYLSEKILLNISDVYFSLNDQEKGLEYLGKLTEQKQSKDQDQQTRSTILQPGNLSFWINALEVEKRLEEERQRNTEAKFSYFLTIAFLIAGISVFSAFAFHFRKREKFRAKENQLKEQALAAKEKKIKYLEKLRDTLNWIHKTQDLHEILQKYGRDIHTNVSNSIAVAMRSIDNLEGELLAIISKEKYEDIFNILEHAYKEARETSHILLDLKIESNPTRTLQSHYQEICEWYKSSNLQIDLSPFGLEKAPISSEIKRYLIAILKEALGNIVKHAEATLATIDVSYTEREGKRNLSIIISDNGIGFTESEIERGAGLNIIEQYIRDIGGEPQILSIPEKGTTIAFNIGIPLEEN